MSASSLLFVANASQVAVQFDGLLAQIAAVQARPNDLSPKDLPHPPYAARLEQLRRTLAEGGTYPTIELGGQNGGQANADDAAAAQPGMSIHFQSADAGVDVTGGWHAPLLDPRIGMVLEIRLWVRHTMMHLLLGRQVDRFTPVFRTHSLRDAAAARVSNYFLSPGQLAAAAESELRLGGWMTLMKHGFDTNPGGRAHARDNYRTHADKSWTDPEDRYPRKQAADGYDIFNAWEPIYDMYYDQMVHVALVYSQARMVRRMTPAEGDAPRAAFMAPAKDTPAHMYIGVPVEYAESVVAFHSSLAMFLALHDALPDALKDQLIVTIYFDGLGFTESDLQPALLRLLQGGIQARLMVNLPLAVRVQSIAMSDVQFFFCSEERAAEPELRAEDALDYGTCGMSAFLRSEPLKLFVDRRGLADLYPFVRNVMRMDLRHDNRTIRDQVRRAKTHTVDLGRHRPKSRVNGTASEDEALVRSVLSRHYPANSHGQLKMVRLEELPQTLSLQHDARMPDGHSATRAFVAKVRRVYDRKQHRLRSGGVPHFLDNYAPTYPKHDMLMPSGTQENDEEKTRRV